MDLVSRHALQFAVSLVLARLLAPEDFGVIAMLQALVTIVGMLVDGGLSTALIQRRELAPIDVSTVFWTQAVCAGIAATALWLGLPHLASLVDVPSLQVLGGVGAIVVMANALAAIQVTLLTRRLDFATQLKAGVVAVLVSAVVAIGLGARGAGVWALAAQLATFSIVLALLLWIFNDWRPQLRWSIRSAAALFGFGGIMLLTNVASAVFDRAATGLIGSLHGTHALGHYHRAETTQQLPSGLLGAIMGRVLLPLLARADGDELRLRELSAQAIRGTMLLNVPMMLGLAAVARPALEALYGARWLPAAPLLQILCVAGLLLPMHLVNVSLLVARGRARLMLHIEIVKKALGLIMMLVGTRHGAMGIAYALAAFSVLSLAVNTHYSGRLLGYGLLAQLRDVAPIFLLAAPMAFGVHLVARMSGAPPLALTIALVSAGAASFFVAAKICRLRALVEAGAFVSGLKRLDGAQAPR